MYATNKALLTVKYLIMYMYNAVYMPKNYALLLNNYVHYNAVCNYKIYTNTYICIMQYIGHKTIFRNKTLMH